MVEPPGSNRKVIWESSSHHAPHPLVGSRAQESGDMAPQMQLEPAYVQLN